MNEYEVVIKTTVTHVFCLKAETPESAKNVAVKRYERGDDGDAVAASIESVRVELP